jgi:hypothetical protein
MEEEGWDRVMSLLRCIGIASAASAVLHVWYIIFLKCELVYDAATCFADWQMVMTVRFTPRLVSSARVRRRM